MLKPRVNKSNNSISDDGIVIKVYTESTKPMHHHTNKINDKSNKKTNINSRGRGGGGGYDRRAQLLARVHELRGLKTSNHQNAEFPEVDNNPNLNKKKGKFRMFSMTTLGLWCNQCFNRPDEKEECGHEPIVTEEYPDKNIDELRYQEAARTSSPKKKRNSKFFKKLKDFLKDLSCIWHCKKC